MNQKKQSRHKWNFKVLALGLLLLVLANVPGWYEAKAFGSGISDTYANGFQTTAHWRYSELKNQYWSIWALLFTVTALTVLQLFFGVNAGIAIVVALLITAGICLIAELTHAKIPVQTIQPDQSMNMTENITNPTNNEVVLT